MSSFQHITIGRIVVYRSRTGNYIVPAIVVATQDTLYEPGVEAGHVPPLTGADNVHLTVFTPGKPGMRMAGTDFKAAPPTHGFPMSENVSGCYQEWDVPFSDSDEPGTWGWPPRV